MTTVAFAFSSGWGVAWTATSSSSSWGSPTGSTTPTRCRTSSSAGTSSGWRLVRRGRRRWHGRDRLPHPAS